MTALETRKKQIDELERIDFTRSRIAQSGNSFENMKVISKSDPLFAEILLPALKQALVEYLEALDKRKEQLEKELIGPIALEPASA